MRPDTDLTIPDGIGSPELDPSICCGLLPRKRLPGDKDLCGFVEEAADFKVFSEARCRELLAESNRLQPTRRPYWQLNQGNHGSCAPESGCESIMAVRERENQEKVKFNPYFNYVQRDVGGGQDRGSSLDSVLRSIRRDGCCPMAVRPRSRGLARPTEEETDVAADYKGLEFFELQTLAAFRTLLLSGIPVCGGYRGHAITFYELANFNQAWYHNSWGVWGEKPHPECKVGGFGLLSLSRIYLAYGLYVFLTTTDTRGLDESRYLQSV